MATEAAARAMPARSPHRGDGGEEGLSCGFVDCNTDQDRALPGTRNYEGAEVSEV